MAEDGTLMKVGDKQGLEEYRLQTTEGAQWQRLFEEKRQAVRNDANEVSTRREQLLAEAVQQEVKALQLIHGQPRSSVRSPSANRPSNQRIQGTGADLGSRWLGLQRQGSARCRSSCRVRRPDAVCLSAAQSADELQSRIIDAKAAERVLVHYGTPSTPEGIEARQAMLGRQSKSAEEDCHDLIGEVIANAVVLKGGGIEEYGTKLGEKLQAAASEASLARLFPEFHKADHSGWGTAVKRAKEGSDAPLTAVGHQGV
jgi:hypothetical protein